MNSKRPSTGPLSSRQITQQFGISRASEQDQIAFQEWVSSASKRTRGSTQKVWQKSPESVPIRATPGRRPLRPLAGQNRQRDDRDGGRLEDDGAEGDDPDFVFGCAIHGLQTLSRVDRSGLNGGSAWAKRVWFCPFERYIAPEAIGAKSDRRLDPQGYEGTGEAHN
jgi:hypothetical protein